MRAWQDVTRRLDEDVMTWPGRRPPSVRWEKRLSEGDHSNSSVWSIEAHSGTHIDAPKHFLPHGASIDQVPLGTLMGPCVLVDIRGGPGEELTDARARALVGAPRVVVRTGFGEDGEFRPHGRLLTPAAAELLVERGLVLIGTDRLSVDGSEGRDFTLHYSFLGRGCVIVEGLDLKQVAAGPYELCALPLLVVGAEASPARVLMSVGRGS